MRNRRVRRFDKPENVLRLALTKCRLTTLSRSRFKSKFPIALLCSPTDPRQIVRLSDENHVQPVRRHTVAIRWVESGKLLIEINAKSCDIPES